MPTPAYESNVNIVTSNVNIALVNIVRHHSIVSSTSVLETIE